MREERSPFEPRGRTAAAEVLLQDVGLGTVVLRFYLL